MEAEVRDARLSRYREERLEFFVKHGSRCRETLADELDVLAPFPLSRSQCAEIFEATDGVGRIYRCVSELLRQCSDDAFVRLGVPVDLLPAVRCRPAGSGPWVIARVDLVLTGEGYKLLELNSDVPGLLVEAFRVNSLVGQFAAAEDPNAGGEALLAKRLIDCVRAAIGHLVRDASTPANVVVTSVNRYVRDTAMAQYVCELLQSVSARYVPADQLTLNDQGLYDAEGSAIP